MDRRKIIIIASVILILLLLVGAYWYFAKKGVVPSPIGTFPGESGVTTGGTTGVTGGEGELSQFTPGKPLPRLYELHKTPVAGAGFFEYETTAGHTVATRYIEKGLGYIFETPLSNYTESRIVNETRSRLSEALWGNNGKSLVVRFIDPSNDWIIKTRLVTIDSGFGSTQDNFSKTSEIFLPDFIPFVATSDDHTDQLFYLENGEGAARGSVSTFTGTSVSKVFNASFTEWLPQYPNQNLITLTTKPSASVLGYLYFVDLGTKVVTKILSGINGLTTLTSHDGKLILFSETIMGAPELSLYNRESGESKNLSLKTLPEKCAWGYLDPTIVYCAVPQMIPEGTYPDQWYQGLVSFSDDLWKINTSTLSTEKIMTPGNFKAPALDIINLVLSSNDAYLLFRNKATDTPWVYQISDTQIFAATPGVSISADIPFTPSTSTTNTDMQKIK